MSSSDLTFKDAASLDAVLCALAAEGKVVEFDEPTSTFTVTEPALWRPRTGIV